MNTLVSLLTLLLVYTIMKILLCVKRIVKQITCQVVMETVDAHLHVVIPYLIRVYGKLWIAFLFSPSLGAGDFRLRLFQVELIVGSLAFN